MEFSPFVISSHPVTLEEHTREPVVYILCLYVYVMVRKHRGFKTEVIDAFRQYMFVMITDLQA